jgi:hypothetical protein
MYISFFAMVPVIMAKLFGDIVTEHKEFALNGNQSDPMYNHTVAENEYMRAMWIFKSVFIYLGFYNIGAYLEISNALQHAKPFWGLFQCGVAILYFSISSSFAASANRMNEFGNKLLGVQFGLVMAVVLVRYFALSFLAMRISNDEQIPEESRHKIGSRFIGIGIWYVCSFVAVLNCLSAWRIWLMIEAGKQDANKPDILEFPFPVAIVYFCSQDWLSLIFYVALMAYKVDGTKPGDVAFMFFATIVILCSTTAVIHTGLTRIAKEMSDVYGRLRSVKSMKSAS